MSSGLELIINNKTVMDYSDDSFDAIGIINTSGWTPQNNSFELLPEINLEVTSLKNIQKITWVALGDDTFENNGIRAVITSFQITNTAPDMYNIIINLNDIVYNDDAEDYNLNNYNYNKTLSREELSRLCVTFDEDDTPIFSVQDLVASVCSEYLEDYRRNQLLKPSA